MTGKTAASSKTTTTTGKLPGTTDNTDSTLAQAATPVGTAVMPPYTTITLSTQHVLTVGTGMEFATLSAALNASQNGDTIVVKAGTYVNDFCTVNTNVTVLAMGGMVNEVATVEPPNGKGIILANANLTIRGFSFTGGSDGSPDGNVSAIRYQSGNLNVSYCDIHDMEEGILATPLVAGTGNIAIDHTEIYNCGTGDGYSHDIYIGAVGRFALTNSYIHNASVGHEVKSRAAVTIIRDNVITDGTGGTSSYEIDVPNAGQAIITGNTLEKGPDASNSYVIHYGGETQYAWANNSLLVSGNTIINNYGSSAVAVLNQSYVNGLSVAARVVNNTLYGFVAQNVLLGLGQVLHQKMLSGDPGYSQAHPWLGQPEVVLQGTTERLDLVTFGNVVTGGSDLLILQDTGGNNTITGGAGGMRLVNTAGWDSVTTQSGSTNTLTLEGRNNTVTSAGHDTIVDSGTYDQIDVSGAADITGSSFASYNLGGSDAVTVNGAGTVHVLSGAHVTATIGANGVTGQKDSGSALVISGSAAQGMQATVTGGSASFGSSNGSDFELTGQHGSLNIVLGAGSAHVTGGDGNDQITTGSGTATITLGGGNDVISFGAGASTIVGGSGAETYVFGAGAGSAVIDGFKQGVDTISMQGASIVIGTIANGSTWLTLSNGALVDLSGVALAAYASPSSGGGSGGSGSGGGSGGGSSSGTTASGNVTLTAGGQSIVGDASLLTVADYAGGNTIAGGTGGLVTSAIGYDVLSTAASSSNSLVLVGHDTLTGSGFDQVLIGGTYDSITENAAANIAVGVYGNTVTGGAGLLQVLDNFGGNTIAGGAGGLNALITGVSDVVSTLAGVSDTVTASGYSTLNLAGNDQVTIDGNYNVLTATGTDVIAANGGWSTYNLDGQETMQGAGAGVVNVGQNANVTLISTGAGGSAVTKAAGGVLQFEQTMPAGAVSAITVSGGAATAGSSGGNYAGLTVTTMGAGDSIVAGTGSDSVMSAGPDTVWAGAGSLTVNASGALTMFGGSGSAMVTAGSAGVSIHGGSGNITLTGGTGNDSFVGGTGSAALWLGGGNDSVTFGAGSEIIHAGASDVFTAVSGMHGSDTIYGFSGNDSIHFQGFSGNAVAGESMSGGNGFLTLTDGSSIELMNVSTLPHFG